MNLLCCLGIIIVLLAILGLLKFFLELMLWIIIVILAIVGVAAIAFFFSSAIP